MFSGVIHIHNVLKLSDSLDVYKELVVLTGTSAYKKPYSYILTWRLGLLFSIFMFGNTEIILLYLNFER